MRREVLTLSVPLLLLLLALWLVPRWGGESDHKGASARLAARHGLGADPADPTGTCQIWLGDPTEDLPRWEEGDLVDTFCLIGAAGRIMGLRIVTDTAQPAVVGLHVGRQASTRWSSRVASSTRLVAM
jgi:hypothetical protein